MKIAFVGKGGSGKTALSALLCRSLAAQGLPVLAIDADINQHLGAALGMSGKEAAAIPPMGIEIAKIKRYLRGDNPLIADDDSMIKTTPPGKGSRLMRISEKDGGGNKGAKTGKKRVVKNPLFRHFVRDSGGVSVMAVGPFDESDLGVKCYHSKTGAVELLLNHVVDREKEYIVIDMTAGADAFASGLFTRFDVTFLAVEPTLKSLGVFKQYKQYARQHDIAINIIGNKIESADDEAFIRKYVPEDDLAGFFHQSAFIKALDRGEKKTFEEFVRSEPENAKLLKKVAAIADSRKKDWRNYYSQAVEFHRKNAESWANQSVGTDLREQIDPHFDLMHAAESLLLNKSENAKSQ